jgi:hypothetical protein
MKWIEALKIYNQSKNMWCIPKKGTEDYNEVIAIMKGERKSLSYITTRTKKKKGVIL